MEGKRLNVQEFSDICRDSLNDDYRLKMQSIVSLSTSERSQVQDGFFPLNKRMINCQNPIISMINVRESWKRKKRRKKKNSASRLTEKPEEDANPFPETEQSS